MDPKTKEYVEEYVEKRLHHFATLVDKEFNEKNKKNIRGVAETLDKAVDDKINASLVKNLGIKWESLQVILAAFAMQLVIIFYFNDMGIKSSIKSSMIEYENDLKDLKKDVKSILQKQSSSIDSANPQPLKDPKKDVKSVLQKQSSIDLANP